MGSLWEKFKSEWSSAEMPSIVPKVEPPTKAKISRAYTMEQLSSEQRQDLEDLFNSDGYEVLQILMQRACEGFTTALLETDPADDKRVLAAHRVAHSAWLFNRSIEKQIEIELELLKAEKLEDRELEKILRKVMVMPDLNDPDVLASVLDATYQRRNEK